MKRNITKPVLICGNCLDLIQATSEEDLKGRLAGRRAGRLAGRRVRASAGKTMKINDTVYISSKRGTKGNLLPPGNIIARFSGIRPTRSLECTTALDRLINSGSGVSEDEPGFKTPEERGATAAEKDGGEWEKWIDDAKKECATEIKKRGSVPSIDTLKELPNFPWHLLPDDSL